MSCGDIKEISCNNSGYCNYRYLSSCGFGCSYCGYCDYQVPKDSRNRSTTLPYNQEVEFLNKEDKEKDIPNENIEPPPYDRIIEGGF